MPATPAISDVEELRHSFRPRRVTTLFIGESPPHGGTFFYQGDSLLHHKMKECFGDIPNFLSEFKAKGFFLDDLVSYPINRIKDERERNRHRWNAVSLLAGRIKEYQPAAVVALMCAIEPMIVEAIRQAGLSHVPLYVTPFPRPEHEKRFKTKMAEILPKLLTAPSRRDVRQ